MNEDNWIGRGARLLIAVIIGILVLAAMGFFSSCTRTVYIPQTTVQRDSIYLTQYKRDSIYMHDSVFVHTKSDTLIVERWRTKYIERVVSDTLYIEKADTLRIPYPVEKPLTTIQKAWIKLGKLSAGFLMTTLIAVFVYFLVRRKI